MTPRVVFSDVCCGKREFLSLTALWRVRVSKRAQNEKRGPHCCQWARVLEKMRDERKAAYFFFFLSALAVFFSSAAGAMPATVTLASALRAPEVAVRVVEPSLTGVTMPVASTVAMVVSATVKVTGLP